VKAPVASDNVRRMLWSILAFSLDEAPQLAAGSSPYEKSAKRLRAQPRKPMFCRRKAGSY
jgi:hypothetical protein